MATLKNHKVTVRDELTGNLNVGDTDIYALPFDEDAPDDAVAMYETTGEPQTSFLGSQSSVLQRAGLQIRRRAPKDNYVNAEEDARTIWETLHNSQPSGYLILKCQGSGPIYIGKDDNGRHEWAINVIIKIVS